MGKIELVGILEELKIGSPQVSDMENRMHVLLFQKIRDTEPNDEIARL